MKEIFNNEREIILNSLSQKLIKDTSIIKNLECDFDIKISELKKKLAEIYKIEPNRQRLLNKGKQFKDDEYLDKLVTKDDTIIHLVFRSEADVKQAQENAQNIGVNICFEKVDILSISPSSFLLNSVDFCRDSANQASSLALTVPKVRPSSRYSTIVSNPPYICNKERKGMEQNVLNHEPSLALFVPDEDPLLFYRAITRFAKNALLDGGNLYFEINPLYAAPLEQLMQEEGFSDIRFRYDSFGKQRFARGTFYKHPS